MEVNFIRYFKQLGYRYFEFKWIFYHICTNSKSHRKMTFSRHKVGEPDRSDLLKVRDLKCACLLKDKW